MKKALNQAWNKRGSLGVLGIAALAFHQLFFPSTSFDRVTSKYLWCDKQEEVTKPTEESINHNPFKIKLDHRFVSSNNGDKLHVGNITLEAVDSRHQTKGYGPNNVGADTMVQLGCPGYIKLNVYQDGKIVRGGKGIEIVYAAKFLGQGGLFDGYPDFSLEDVLERTWMMPWEVSAAMEKAGSIVQNNLAEEARIREEQEIKRKRDVVDKFYKTVEENPERKRSLDICRKKFVPVNSYSSTRVYTHVVGRGESKVSISRDFNNCNKAKLFFPELFRHLDTVYGSKVCDSIGRECNSSPSDNLHSGQVVYVKAGRPEDITPRSLQFYSGD